MSYILDALRRAEAERERGAVPSLHTEQFPAMADDDDRPPRSKALIATVVVLAVALAALLAWTAFGGRGITPPAVSVASGTVTPAVPGTATFPVAPPPPVAGSMPVALPAAAASATPGAAVAPASSPAPAKRERKRPAPPKPQAGSVDTAGNGDRVYREAELPDAARRAMPKLVFGGSSYSSAAGSRMVIWNGRVFHEGDTIAAEVVLRRIDRKSAQLSVKGYRVDVAF